MKTFDISCLLLLLFSIGWDTVDCLCSLDKYTAALCHDLEDARYINTYHLHTLRAPSSSKILSPGNFQNLTSLRHLDLSNGRIEIIESGSFARLESLQTLNMSNNRISHLEAGAFDGLKHVHNLILRGNVIRQLPSALMSLQELKLLDISDNPLNCNCASMKLRDALIARGIKITKKTYCSEPISVKHALIWKPDTKTTCLFEKQDTEMQRDQPLEDSVDGSGEAEEDDIFSETEKDFSSYDEKEDDRSTSNENEEETVAPTTAEMSSSFTTSLTTSSENIATDIISSSTSLTKDDITFEDTEDSLGKETTTVSSSGGAVKPEESEESDKTDDLIIPIVPRDKDTSNEPVSSSAASTSETADDIIVSVEGSGESDDDGSGTEGSGIIARMPPIDFNETSEGFEDEEDQVSASSTTTTTESSSWWGLGSIIGNLNPWGSSDATEAPKITEKNPEDDLKEEQFIQVTRESSTSNSVEPVKESVIVPNSIPTDEGTSKQTPKPTEFQNIDLDDNFVDTEPSQETKKGIGSYVVLILLLVVLTILLSFAAYKGDFCRKKRKRRDVERGTEMKDMQRTLLDQNKTQSKVQALNGNTMENVPLMNSAALPEEPKNKQKSYDITPTVVTNGSSRLSSGTNGTVTEVNDPVKPSRKSLKHEIEAPLNGLNPPMEAIDAPIGSSLHGDSTEIINTLDYCERPPLTPGAHRVKITLQENPDSVPKTPILITRVKDGENLVKAP